MEETYTLPSPLNGRDTEIVALTPDARVRKTQPSSVYMYDLGFFLLPTYEFIKAGMDIILTGCPQTTL